MISTPITVSIFAQLALFLVVHGVGYCLEIESPNLLYLGNMMEFLESLPFRTLWSVAFWRLFPGQFWIYLALPLLAITSLWKAEPSKWRLCLFHLFSALWISLPFLTRQFGDYRGP